MKVALAVSIAALAGSVSGDDVQTINGRRYLRPVAVDNMPLEEFDQHHNGKPQQVSIVVSGTANDLFNYTIRFATNSSYEYARTGCKVRGAESHGRWGKGVVTDEPQIHSMMLVGGEYNNPKDIYTSPWIHECHLLNLAPSSAYEYKVNHLDKKFSLVTPPVAGQSDFEMLVVADVGQTNYSAKTMEAALKYANGANEDNKPLSTIMWSGDLSYADGYFPRWDTFGLLAQPLLSTVEALYAPGNHEFDGGEAFTSFRIRYKGLKGPMWGSDIRGPVHIITLDSYTDLSTTGAQYRWFKKHLENNVDRKLTPWLVVQSHVPMYCSNTGHSLEGETIRKSYEPLMNKHKVDFYFGGHVHAYERSHPVNNYTVEDCGVVHITIGDGGNRETAKLDWYQDQLWSAARESTFGFGAIKFQNNSMARWRWVRNENGFFNFPGQTVFPNEYFAKDDVVQIDRSKCHDFN